MIRLLNAYFIPVYTTIQDYVGKPAVVPDEEKDAYQRIYHAALKKKLSTGTVHLYFLTPDGDPMDTIHVAHANPDRVIATAKGVIEKLGTPEGKPLVQPRPQATAPKARVDDLVLYLIARAVPGKHAGFWHELPGEDFIVYSRDEWSKFLPPSGSAVGVSWEINRDTALKLLNYFYPSTENNDVSKNEIETVSMKATLVGANRVRLDVRLIMKHPFYHQKDSAQVDATAVGVLDLDGSKSKIRKFRMATEQAIYNGGTFGVAVRSIP